MLEISLGRLYRAIATWRPPGRQVGFVCLSCLRSPFRDAAALAPLPEEVVHEFLLELDAVVARRLGDLRDEREAIATSLGWEGDLDETPDNLTELVEIADKETWAFLAHHHEDIEQMRLLQLEPRLAAWIEHALIPLELDQWPDWFL